MEFKYVIRSDLYSHPLCNCLTWVEWWKPKKNTINCNQNIIHEKLCGQKTWIRYWIPIWGCASVKFQIINFTPAWGNVLGVSNLVANGVLVSLEGRPSCVGGPETGGTRPLMKSDMGQQAAMNIKTSPLVARHRGVFISFGEETKQISWRNAFSFCWESTLCIGILGAGEYQKRSRMEMTEPQHRCWRWNMNRMSWKIIAFFFLYGFEFTSACNQNLNSSQCYYLYR